MKPAETYRVIGVRADGSREIRASGLGKDTAEAVRALTKSSGLFVQVIIENESSDDGKPPAS